MMKLFIVRHCKAIGQCPQAELTAEGHKQAETLADFLVEKGIDSIISSPFLRTVQSIQPLAQRLNLEIKIDDRLAERVLSSENLPDWMDHLRISFDELDRSLPGGESSRAAMDRIVSVINEIAAADLKNIAIVTHGNLMSLLLKYCDPQFGFEQWRTLSNPDVYGLSLCDNSPRIERIWREEY